MTVKTKRPRVIIPPEMTAREGGAYRAGYDVGHRHGLEDAEKELRQLILVRDELAAITAQLRELTRGRT